MEDHEIESQDSDFVEDTPVDKVWPRKVESYFIELLAEEVKKGSKKTTTLSSSGWKTVKQALKEKFDKEFQEFDSRNCDWLWFYNRESWSSWWTLEDVVQGDILCMIFMWDIWFEMVMVVSFNLYILTILGA